MKLTKSQRAQLVMKFGGKCAYCGIDLSGIRWHADHVEPIRRIPKYVVDENGKGKIVASGKIEQAQADVFSNLFPSCASCNIDKHATPLYLWRRRLEDLIDNLRRNSSPFRHAERFGRLSIVNSPVVFWFERYEASESNGQANTV
jgi:5-methylcytosine-specific restriction endonuclease McrA